MVWVGISAQGKTELITAWHRMLRIHFRKNGTPLAERYVSEILDVHTCRY